MTLRAKAMIVLVWFLVVAPLLTVATQEGLRALVGLACP